MKVIAGFPMACINRGITHEALVNSLMTYGQKWPSNNVCVSPMDL